MTDDQIETMLKMHRFLMQCEIKYVFDEFAVANGERDPRVAELQKEMNDSEWFKFNLWLRKIRDE